MLASQRLQAELAKKEETLREEQERLEERESQLASVSITYTKFYTHSNHWFIFRSGWLLPVSVDSFTAGSPHPLILQSTFLSPF